MKKCSIQLALAGMLALGTAATAHAGLLTYQGVTFTSSWTGNQMSLRIDAANPSGDWTGATDLAALGLKDIGTVSKVTLVTAPGAASGWKYNGVELAADGCSGKENGAAGSRLCFYGAPIALSDGMLFTFAFEGKINAVDPHVKVEFIDAKGVKTGSLLSQTLPLTPPPLVPPLPPVVPPTPPQPPLLPPSQPPGGGGNGGEVPEPSALALLAGGLGLLGLSLRRRPRD